MRKKILFVCYFLVPDGGANDPAVRRGGRRGHGAGNHPEFAQQKTKKTQKKQNKIYYNRSPCA